MSNYSFHVLVLSLVVALLYRPLESENLLNHSFTAHNRELDRILLLTAHPDDEALFFGPTINALKRDNLVNKAEIYLLCLSIGNAEGLGIVRRLELERSLDVFGIDPEKRWIVDHPYASRPLGIRPFMLHCRYQ